MGGIKDPVRRFETNHIKNPDTGCWEWTGYTSNGYAKTTIDSQPTYVHRWAYERFVGPIPDGCEIHHTCRTKACVNPDHLRPLTTANHRDISGADARIMRGHCSRGHVLTPDNVAWHARPGRHAGRPERVCKACARLRSQRYYRRRLSPKGRGP